MTKNSKCSNERSCGRIGEHKILKYWDGSSNIDGVGYWHMECIFCGCQFNIWDCGSEKIKKMFEENYKSYEN